MTARNWRTHLTSNLKIALLYFKIEPGQSFHPLLKYPPYRRCIPREQLTKVNVTGGRGKRWRLYWSKFAWDAYYFENGDEVTNWELEKENGDGKTSFWKESAYPVLIMIAWITVAGSVGLFFYPLLAMAVFRLMFWTWELATNRFVRRICRWIIIKIEKSKRNNVLSVYRNAGRKPPVYKYKLPKFLREDPHEATPKELDESEEEFWSSDDELNMMGQGVMKNKKMTYKPTPEFTPEYPPEVEEMTDGLLSRDMFTYLRKVKQHGMFAVWTEGTDNIDLAEISQSNNKPPKLTTSKEQLS
ncbi:hypothetical protein Fcan01_09915 [Folsomia candida]|uniref:Uncharacterized protein n=1 Tax=Folsomia candida TaxID=158441 RepID=A0A226EG16_FOLCA|nr:hypothetical protein Fcan01_09915 [Folsomia candida]